MSVPTPARALRAPMQNDHRCTFADAVGLDAEELLNPVAIDQECLQGEDGDQDQGRDAGTELGNCVHGVTVRELLR